MESSAVSAGALPRRVLLVTGPTAAGKSELAAGLARALDAEIVGADSRQIYRHMDAGTAKPPPALRHEIPHHLIDVVDPDADYDVARWCDDALAGLAEIAARGRRAIVCGGTGLYLRSLTRGLFKGPPADRGLRERLSSVERASPGALHARLRAVDPTAAVRIHANDEVRLVRALEVVELTGRPISSWQTEHALADVPFESLTLEVRVERDELRRRIAARSSTIVEAGIVEELRALYAHGYAADLKAFDAIGYREAALCIDGALAMGDLADRIAHATFAYAKRQLVWIAGQLETVPIPHDGARVAIELARRFFGTVANGQGIG